MWAGKQLDKGNIKNPKVLGHGYGKNLIIQSSLPIAPCGSFHPMSYYLFSIFSKETLIYMNRFKAHKALNRCICF